MKQNHTFTESWIWPDTVTKFVKDNLVGYSLNVCAGVNPLCDVNLDIDPKDKSILKGDMRCLPFDAETFDTVISDPPWKIGYYERMRPFFECVRVCKLYGKIIYNATWIPESTDVEIQKIFVRQDAPFGTTSIITVFKKMCSNEEYENQIFKERFPETVIEKKRYKLR